MEKLKEVLEKIKKFKIEITAENVKDIDLVIQRTQEDRVYGYGRMLGPRDRLIHTIPFVIDNLNRAVNKWLLRPGGVVESAAGKYLKPIVLKQAQDDYESLLKDGN